MPQHYALQRKCIPLTQDTTLQATPPPQEFSDTRSASRSSQSLCLSLMQSGKRHSEIKPSPFKDGTPPYEHNTSTTFALLLHAARLLHDCNFLLACFPRTLPPVICEPIMTIPPSLFCQSDSGSRDTSKIASTPTSCNCQAASLKAHCSTFEHQVGNHRLYAAARQDLTNLFNTQPHG